MDSAGQLVTGVRRTMASSISGSACSSRAALRARCSAAAACRAALPACRKRLAHDVAVPQQMAADHGKDSMINAVISMKRR